MRFNGADYTPERDNQRLTNQLFRVWDCMVDGKWRTLGEISKITGDPEASVSAQLRHLRKRRFGEHLIERRYCGNGLYEYKLTPNDGHSDS
jgi:hypothetical protein